MQHNEIINITFTISESRVMHIMFANYRKVVLIY